MEQSEIKAIIARHCDYKPAGEGQFYLGEWLAFKHKDSLCDMLEELNAEYEEELSEALRESAGGAEA